MITGISPDGERDTGMTLVEMLIAMGITALIAVLAGSLFVTSTHSVSLAQSIDGGTRQASNGMNEMARMIRAATQNPLANPVPGSPQNEPAIYSGGTTSITFYAYVNLSGAESPVMVTFSVNAQGQLRETQYAATSTTAGVNGHWDFNTTTPLSSRALCNSIPASVQVFHYYNQAGVEVAAPGTDPAARAAVASIGLVVTIQPTGAASAVTLTNTIGMANIGSGAGS